VSSRKPRAAKPAPAPRRGPGRPAKSDLDKAIDKFKAALLTDAIDTFAEHAHALQEMHGNPVPMRELRAMFIRYLAVRMNKSPDTIRDMMRPARRVLRKKGPSRGGAA
jgi:hypothetical protein